MSIIFTFIALFMQEFFMYFCSMTNRFTNVLTFLKNTLSSIDLKVYSISVAIAFVIWLVMTLSDVYNERVEFPVTYSNFPPGLVLVNNPASDISVDVKSQGFELASVALSEKKSVNIDLNEIKFRKTKYGRFVASVPTRSFRYDIVNQLNVDDVGKDFIPDSVFFIFDSLISKKLPVKFNSNMKYSEGYIAYGEPDISPKNVIVTGPAWDINKLNYILTSEVKNTNVNSNYEDELSLVKGKKISLDKNVVFVKQAVAKYSEFSISREVNLLSNIPNLKVKFFPKSVDILFSMPLPDYKKLSDTSFTLTVRVDSLDVLQNKKILIDILQIPKGSDNVRLSSQSVEYIILD